MRGDHTHSHIHRACTAKAGASIPIRPSRIDKRKTATPLSYLSTFEAMNNVSI